MKKTTIFILITFLSIAVFSAAKSAPSQGRMDPDFIVDIYDPDKAWKGNTILADNHDRRSPRVIEINMKGEIIWEYVLPMHLRRFTNPGFDVELLSTGNILLVLPGKGIYEINRKGKTVWSHSDNKVSHDVDRLSNGNTLYVYGNEDKKDDPQVKEVDHSGKLAWSWYAKDEFFKVPFKDIYRQGWTHTNAVTRLENGNTLISPRNFNFLVEVNPQGRLVRKIGEGYLKDQHDPEILPNGNILVANHDTPHEVLEIDTKSDRIIWRYPILKRKAWPVRDADRLPNGNTLITGTTVILEVTHDKDIVWLFRMKNIPFRSPKDAPALGFYKAQRARD